MAAGVGKPKPLVLFSCRDDFMQIGYAPELQRRWELWAIPLDLYQLIDPREFARLDLDMPLVTQKLREAGVERRLKRRLRWPQPLGYRIVRLLAERGRIAFGLFSSRLDLKRGARQSVAVNEDVWQPRRVEADELLAALQAAGSRLARTG